MELIRHLISHCCTNSICPVVWLLVASADPVGVAPESHPVTPGECPLLGEVLETNEGGLHITQPGGETLQSCVYGKIILHHKCSNLHHHILSLRLYLGQSPPLRHASPQASQPVCVVSEQLGHQNN